MNLPKSWQEVGSSRPHQKWKEETPDLHLLASLILLQQEEEREREKE